jgi:hypothetical protein
MRHDEFPSHIALEEDKANFRACCNPKPTVSASENTVTQLHATGASADLC